MTSAHYLLSDLYITDDVDESDTSSEQSTEDSDDQTEQVSELHHLNWEELISVLQSSLSI